VLKGVRLRRQACFRYQSQRVLRVGVLALGGGRGSHRPAEPCDCAIRRACLITQESRPKLLLKILQICRDEQQSFAQRLKSSFALSVTLRRRIDDRSRCCFYMRSLAYLTLSKEGAVHPGCHAASGKRHRECWGKSGSATAIHDPRRPQFQPSRTTDDHRAGSERFYLLFFEPALLRDNGSPHPVALR
jgi:hypothetical protein